MSTSSASQQIEELEQKIRELRHQAIAELKEQLVQARKNVADLENQLSQLTGNPAEAAGAASAAPARRTRRASISDEALKPMILKAMAQFGTAGLNAKEIAGHVGQDPLRIRKFIAANPTALKRQGSGPGTRFFLR